MQITGTSLTQASSFSPSAVYNQAYQAKLDSDRASIARGEAIHAESQSIYENRPIAGNVVGSQINISA